MNEEKEIINENTISKLPEDNDTPAVFKKGNDDIEIFTGDTPPSPPLEEGKNTSPKEGEKKEEFLPQKKKRKKWKFLRDFFINVVVLVFVLAIIRGFIALPFEVSGNSMEATLHDRELIYVDLFSPYIRGIKRGDVIVFHPPTNQTTQAKGPMCLINTLITKLKGKDTSSACIIPVSYVKRVIGVAGDVVEIKGGSVYITDEDGKKQELSESYLTDENKGKTCFGDCKSEVNINGKSYTIPEGQYFLMGDNRLHSSDSRTWNFVKREDITGVVRAVFFYHGADSFSHAFSESAKKIRIIHSIDPISE